MAPVMFPSLPWPVAARRLCNATAAPSGGLWNNGDAMLSLRGSRSIMAAPEAEDYSVSKSDGTSHRNYGLQYTPRDCPLLNIDTARLRLLGQLHAYGMRAEFCLTAAQWSQQYDLPLELLPE